MVGLLETDIEELMDFIKENNLAQKFVDWKFRRKYEETNSANSQEVKSADKSINGLRASGTKSPILPTTEQTFDTIHKENAPNQSQQDIKTRDKSLSQLRSERSEQQEHNPADTNTKEENYGHKKEILKDYEKGGEK